MRALPKAPSFFDFAFLFRFTKRRDAVAVALVLAFSLATPVKAASGKQLQDACINTESGEPAVAACTALIDSGRQPRKNLAVWLSNRGGAYAKLGQYARAIQDLDQAIRLDPNSAAAFVNRGYAYEGLEQYGRAIQDYDRAIRLEPDSAIAFDNRGVSYRRLGEYGRAIQDYDHAIRLDPRKANTFNNRGYAYLSLDQYERAIQDFDKAIQLQPDFMLALANRSAAREKLGDADGAKADLERRDELKKLAAGKNNNPVAPMAGAGCRPVAGDWFWFNGGMVTISDDGALNWRTNKETPSFPAGKWRCDNGRFTFAWNNGFVDTLQLADNDKVLRGKNAQGVPVTGYRRGDVSRR